MGVSRRPVIKKDITTWRGQNNQIRRYIRGLKIESGQIGNSDINDHNVSNDVDNTRSISTSQKNVGISTLSSGHSTASSISGITLESVEKSANKGVVNADITNSQHTPGTIKGRSIVRKRESELLTRDFVHERLGKSKKFRVPAQKRFSKEYSEFQNHQIQASKEMELRQQQIAEWDEKKQKREINRKIRASLLRKRTQKGQPNMSAQLRMLMSGYIH